jgi:hypothetical protein
MDSSFPKCNSGTKITSKTAQQYHRKNTLEAGKREQLSSRLPRRAAGASPHPVKGEDESKDPDDVTEMMPSGSLFKRIAVA